MPHFDMVCVDQRMETALNMHDAMLLNAPDGATHDAALCPFCGDWSMSDSGVPSGYGRLDLADAKKPYGNVTYADPGYQSDGVKRYPIDTEAHARAAWSYIHQASNAGKYSPEQMSSIRSKVQAALKRFGVATDANADPKKSKTNSTDSSVLIADFQPGVASEGGTPKHMDTITQETHEALLDKALRDATASLEAEKAALLAENTALVGELDGKQTENAQLKTENERLNGELDAAQVTLKTAQDEAESLKADIASKEEEARKEKLASERAAQVRNLSLFPEEYVNDKASRWADMDEAGWTERLDEWKAAKGQTAPVTNSPTDIASAITGSREISTGQRPSARRLALGLID